MKNNNSHKELVEKIISHSNLSQSSIYPKLLIYLMECSASGYTPKETDIAQNVFDRSDFDASTDPLIRVHVSKLRKKLEEYYENEGKGDGIKINIPPRHYNIEYVKNIKTHDKTVKTGPVPWILTAFLMMFLILSVFLFLNNRKLVKQIAVSKMLASDRLIWSDFLHTKLPTIFTIGNVYTYCEYNKDLKNYLIVNNPLVNDSKSLEDFIRQSDIPSHYIWEPVWELLPKSALLNYSRINWFFRLSEKDIVAKLSTKMEWEDFRRNNIIYLGHFHNLGMLIEFYNTQHIYSPHLELDFQKRKALIKTDSLNIIFDNIGMDKSTPIILSSYLESNLQRIELTYPDMDTCLSLIESKETNYIKDYVAVSKLPGPNKNYLLYIISMHQIGRMEVIKVLTDFESYKNLKMKIKENYKIMPKYFEMIIEVEGFKETAMKIELVHFYSIDEESLERHF